MTRHECPDCELICWQAADGGYVCLECDAEWPDEASIASGAPGLRHIKWYPRAPVLTPNGVQRLYSWHPAPECRYVYTTDDGERVHMWTKDQIRAVVDE